MNNVIEKKDRKQITKDWIPNMPTYTRILTPLPDFIILTDEILTQYNASVFLEVKRNDAIINRRIVADDIARFVRSDRDKNLHF